MTAASAATRHMASKKGFVKVLAAGAVLGAVAAMLHAMKDKNEKTRELEEAALRIKDKVADHAKRLGKLSKTAYGKIVDTTMAEYKGMKALTTDELGELKAELKSSWKDIEAVMKSKPVAKKKKSAATKKSKK